MTDQVNVRELVLASLLAVTRDGEYSHVVLRGVLEKYQYLTKQERSFFTRVFEGTLEHMMYLDYIINQFSSVKVNKMKPVIRCILRSGVYELKFMDSVPASATCNEAVKLAKKHKFSNLSGFVNGVLRKISRSLEEIRLPDREEDPVFWLSVKYSVPEWIIELWRNSYDIETIEAILLAFQEENPTAIRVNTDKTTREALAESLKKQKIKVRIHPEFEDVLFMENYDFLGAIPEFTQGSFYVQDISSMMVSRWAQPKEGSRVLDVCAAPGGKSIHMAQLLHGTGLVEARDLTEQKVALIEENVERCGLSNVRTVQADARVYDGAWQEKADIVIADLPCSGLGVIGKKPDIKYRVTQEDCKSLAALQREILHTVQNYVKPGGVLMYSTCTINPGENEENVRWFLQEHPWFTLERQQQMLPKAGENDGFFLARLVRNKG